MLAHVHCAFLSDPDWTEFHLQLLWGAALMLPAAAILHFTESQWRTFHPCQNFDPATVDDATFDSSIRAVMLHRFGISYKLVDLPPRLLHRLREHLDMFRQHTAPLIRSNGIVRPLTEQPRRDGGGERFPAFQLVAGDRSVLAVHRLDGAADRCTLRVPDLDPASAYRVTLLGPDSDPADLPVLGGAATTVVPGGELARDGLRLVAASSATSWLIAVEPAPPVGALTEGAVR